MCPPEDTNTSDCGDDNVGNGWRALDASGETGKAVIQNYVDRKQEVSTDYGKCEGGAAGGCTVGSTVYVDASFEPGAVALVLGHEDAHHVQFYSGDWYSTPEQYADIELGAWDMTRPLFNALSGLDVYGPQVVNRFGGTMSGLLDPSIRAAVRRQLIQSCRARGCVP